MGRRARTGVKPGVPELEVRLMDAVDLPAVATISAAAFGIDIATPAARARWLERVGHGHQTDPDGCFVAVRDGRVVGVSQALLRDGLWVLSLLAVAPETQSDGTGRAVLRRALGYGAPDAPALIVSSNDPRALRLYAMAGFELRPTFVAQGAVDRRAIPVQASLVKEEREPDLERLAEISRAVRGGAHTPEIAFALRRGGRLLRVGRRGFAIAQPGQGVWLLVAVDAEAASVLLWRALELSADAETTAVRWIGADQQWAIPVLVRAGLAVTAYGALCVRGPVGPLPGYIPSAPFG